MILIQHNDKKAKCIIEQLTDLGLHSETVIVKHPILNPINLLENRILKKKNINVYVFRYINDNNNHLLSIVRYLSDLFLILLLKLFKIRIWWLCHNVDKETTQHYPKYINKRRNLIYKNAEIIFTTNKHLVDKAQEIFVGKKIDYISLGFIESGIHNLEVNLEQQSDIESWITERKSEKSKFLFCIGAPANKSLHFEHVNNLVTNLNNNSEFNWYAIVIGKKVKPNNCIYNVGNKCVLSKEFIIKYCDYFYRVINDFSISYSIFEAVKFKKPIITEQYGVIPKIVDEYNLGVVINYQEDLEKQILEFDIEKAMFEKFEQENNWKVAALKFKQYYDTTYNQ